ncbi:MAG: S1 RNA-binding domain-containing protein [Snowella sp.]|nr:S1 RNA-binding domain-containing protein [Snowella sp.]
MTASSRSSSAGFSHDDFAKALEKHDYHADKGQIVRGKVSQHTSDGAYVEIGGKSPGFIPMREIGLHEIDNLAEALPLETEWEFLVTSEQNSEGQVQLSRRQLQLQQAWDEINEAAESGKALQIRITGMNKGGVTGDVAGLRGFIPRSHLVEKNDLDSLMGQLLTANILEANQETNKLVLSQRKVMQAQAMTTIAKGTLCAGRIVKLQPYGVFVDLNGVTGLLHITQVSGTRIEALDKVFQYGQEVQVVVLDIDEFKNRISLSTKILEAYPGELLENFEAVMGNAPERFEQAQAKLAEMA